MRIHAREPRKDDPADASRPLRIAPMRSGDARVFVSFDQEHDGDLHDRLVAEASGADSGFEIAGRSGELTRDDPWEERQRSLIRAADLMVVLCGEHTDESRRVAAELRMAQEEGTPYLMLWGRREVMCTLPTPARKKDGMYSWTPEILRDRLRVTLRDADEAEAEAAKAAERHAAAEAAAESEGTTPGEGAVGSETPTPAARPARRPRR